MHVAAGLQLQVVPVALPPMLQVCSTPGCCTVICPLATTPFWKLLMELYSNEVGSVTCRGSKSRHLACSTLCWHAPAARLPRGDDPRCD